jgi:predicted metalloendopeptidase
MKSEDSTSQKYWLIVIELDDVVDRRDPRKPNLYVAKTVTPPEERFATVQRTKKKHWYTEHVKRLRTDLGTSRTYKSGEEAKQALLKLTRKLTSEGYTVNRNTQVWTVYVIELDKTAVTNPGKGYVYVGETSRTPEERFKQHRDGARNKKGRLYAGVVKQHGVKLRPDLAPRKKYFDHASAKRGEKEHFEFLKSKGFNVKGGH